MKKITVFLLAVGCAAAVQAQFLQNHPQVAWVRYAGLPGDKYYDLGKKYLPKGCCGVVSFGVKGGRSAAEKFMAQRYGMREHMSMPLFTIEDR